MFFPKIDLKKWTVEKEERMSHPDFEYSFLHTLKNKSIMKAYIFPGQGSQFPGMGKDLFDRFEMAKEMFHVSDEILGFDLSTIS